MLAKYQNNRVSFPEGDWLQNPDERSTGSHAEDVTKQIGAYKSHMSTGRTFPFMLPVTFGSFVVNAAIGNILAIADQGNRLVENAAPWKLAKDLEGISKIKLNSVLYALAETLRIIAILISPMLPKSAHGIFDQLNWKMDLSGKKDRFSLAEAEWGRLPDGHVVGRPVPLFPRIEVDEGV